MPWLKYHQKKSIPMLGIAASLGVDVTKLMGTEQQSIEDKYCETCKRAKRGTQDCSKCTKVWTKMEIK